jgi:hypothetical protein
MFSSVRGGDKEEGKFCIWKAAKAMSGDVDEHRNMNSFIIFTQLYRAKNALVRVSHPYLSPQIR